MANEKIDIRKLKSKLLKCFVMASYGDPDLNTFIESDVENGKFSFLTLSQTDSLQRWMRDAIPGDRRAIGKDEIICIARYGNELW